MQPPTPAVVRAFGGSPADHLRRLPGGQGQSWRFADVVLKPVGCRAETEWVVDVLDSWPDDAALRVPHPLRAVDGSWVYDGWAAHRWVEGRDVRLPDELELVRRASDDFHRVVQRLARPAFLDDRSDPWSYGDRVAWEGATPQGHEATRHLLEVGLAALQPVSGAFQVIHGDIGGNVLVAEGMPAAVIDWPPYFRPVGFALAVAAGDAICWSGAPLSLLDEWSDVPEWDQLLLRAIIYRVATRGRAEELGTVPTSSEEYVEQRRVSLDAVLSRLA